MSDVVLHRPPTESTIAYVGAVARADLLPQEVRDRVATRTTRRLVFLLVILAVVVVAAAYVGVSSLALTSQLALGTAQARTNELVAQQSAYAEINTLRASLATRDVVERVGTATALDWEALYRRVAVGLPRDGAITAFRGTAQTALTPFAMPTAPLQAPRIGTIGITASAPDLAAITEWIADLKAEPMFSDVVASTVATGEGGFVTELTISLSPELTPMPGGEQ